MVLLDAHESHHHVRFNLVPLLSVVNFLKVLLSVRVQRTNLVVELHQILSEDL